MADAQQLLSEFIAADQDGQEPDPLAYLERTAGRDRSELEALIDDYLAQSPRRAFDAAAYAESPARAVVDDLSHALAGQSGLWPALLPRLRHRAQLKRAELVQRLAADLGAAELEDKVGGYYHAMERGTLPAERVSDRVLEALSRILGESAKALREAGRGLAEGSGGAPGAPVFARVVTPTGKFAEVGPAPSAATSGPEPELDFVDELFTGESAPGSRRRP